MSIFHYNKTVANEGKKCDKLGFKGTLLHHPQYYPWIIMEISITSAFLVNGAYLSNKSGGGEHVSFYRDKLIC